jgi:hypothetical protein
MKTSHRNIIIGVAVIIAIAIQIPKKPKQLKIPIAKDCQEARVIYWQTAQEFNRLVLQYGRDVLGLSKNKRYRELMELQEISREQMGSLCPAITIK